MIRKLTKEEIPEYQHLITTVWNETYPGIINDTFLKSLYQGEQVRIELDLYMFNEQTNQILVIEENNKLYIPLSSIIWNESFNGYNVLHWSFA